MAQPVTKGTRIRGVGEDGSPLNGPICVNTGTDANVCRCLDCFPYTIPLTWAGTAKTMDEAVAALREMTTYLNRLKKEGWTTSGSTSDDHVELLPPKKEGYYWARCGKCGRPVAVEDGSDFPASCQECECSKTDTDCGRLID